MACTGPVMAQTINPAPATKNSQPEFQKSAPELVSAQPVKQVANMPFPKKSIAASTKSVFQKSTKAMSGDQYKHTLKWAIGLSFLLTFVLTLLYMKRKGVGGFGRGKGKCLLRVVQSMAIHQKQRISIIEADGERMVIGISNDRMTLLSKRSMRDEAVHSIAPVFESEVIQAESEVEKDVNVSNVTNTSQKSSFASMDKAAANIVDPINISSDRTAGSSSVEKQIEDRIKNLKKFLIN